MNSSSATTTKKTICASEPWQRWPVYRPLLALLFFTVIFRRTNADLIVSSWFYDSTTHDWWLLNAGPCVWLYNSGTYPAFALFVGGLVEWIVGLFRQRKTHIRSGAYLMLVFAIGPGLIVNLGLKDHWGRPRPNQVREFDGNFAFAPVGSPGTLDRHNSSFPSGHAAVAFYLIAPAFTVRPQRKLVARGLMATGLAFGFAMAVVRVVQGGHFLSDVVWSAAIVYLVAWGLERVMYRERYAARMTTAMPESATPMTIAA